MMFISQPCYHAVYRKILRNIWNFSKRMKLTIILSGVNIAYRADFYVDIFINNFNFNEKLFLQSDNEIKIIPNVNYIVYIKIWCDCKQWNS